MSVSVLPHEAIQKTTPFVSIVVPIFNEVDNVPHLYLGIRSAMDRSGYSWEVVFVDDGSTDGSTAVLRNLHAQYTGVRVVELRRNFGQTAAMAAGFDHARGEVIIAMDGDLQNDPKDIPRLIEKLDEGFDVVSGWRTNRQDGFWLRRLPSPPRCKLCLVPFKGIGGFVMGLRGKRPSNRNPRFCSVSADRGLISLPRR